MSDITVTVTEKETTATITSYAPFIEWHTLGFEEYCYGFGEDCYGFFDHESVRGEITTYAVE
jgi:hypothetical protein